MNNPSYWWALDVAWFWGQVAAAAPFAWFLGELKGASDEMVSWEGGYQVAWFWSQVAQAAMTNMLWEAFIEGNPPGWFPRYMGIEAEPCA